MAMRIMAAVFAIAGAACWLGAVCWLFPGAIGGSRVIGSLLFVVAAALFMIRKP